MKIIGIGVDIVQNKRIKSLIKNDIFLRRIYSKIEIEKSKQVKNRSIYFSKRFAAKESFSKALGIGIRNNLNFKDIEIINDKLGKPYFRLNSKIKNIIKSTLNIKNFNLFLSISDEKEYSIAFTIIQNKNV